MTLIFAAALFDDTDGIGYKSSFALLLHHHNHDKLLFHQSHVRCETDQPYQTAVHKHNNQKGHNHRDNHHHSNNFEDDEQYNPFNQPSPPQLDSDDNTEQPMSWKKMHWHATRIDKVQDLVPEQVR